MEKLGIGGNGRHFVRGERPFFWLGDTAWRLFAALDNEQSRVYLQNRADKGFNAVLAVLLSRVTYHAAENSRVEILYGDMQEFISAENEPYWAHVENVVAMGREAGLYMALLPVWGSFAKEGFINIDNAADYMDFLCKRFNKYENIIWLLGGDIRGDKNADMWDICGARLRENMPDGLIGFHPFGRTSSSYWFHNRDWLDFNMFQSGHRRYDQRNLSEWDEGAAGEPWHGEDNWRYVCADLGKSPQKPTLDGEPSYEQIPQGLHDGSQPFWQDFHIRRYGW
ncbi:MAG: DUF4038 domain-containing protein, partial [Defluviitaleaceae bacterium]|nr:DUF4038 domain-containing protein [Defluviitaleaceae bacterium]